MTRKHLYLPLLTALFVPTLARAQQYTSPTTDDGKRLLLPPSEIPKDPHHLHHLEVFGKYVTGYNRAVLQAIDTVQSTAPQGGGYFIGVKAVPAESPIGYSVKLFGTPLLSPPRTTSYCSGSSYTVFIEAMNLILPQGANQISADRIEAMRMQEPNGGRREDDIKFWGHWNADGPGSQYALVQYSNIGKEITPENARPGDFVNISWKSGLGHSVVFLGFCTDDKGEKRILYWSSQKGTNGLGDQSSPLSKVQSVKFVRLINPEKVFEFDVNKSVAKKVPGDPVE